MAQAKKTTLRSILKDPRSHRKGTGVSQGEFWPSFGVTQSGGSRYESGRAMPMPLKILLVLHAQGIISDMDLQEAKKLAK